LAYSCLWRSTESCPKEQAAATAAPELQRQKKQNNVHDVDKSLQSGRFHRADRIAIVGAMFINSSAESSMHAGFKDLFHFTYPKNTLQEVQ
jgi:hypothetical protein